MTADLGWFGSFSGGVAIGPRWNCHRRLDDDNMAEMTAQKLPATLRLVAGSSALRTIMFVPPHDRGPSQFKSVSTGNTTESAGRNLWRRLLNRLAYC